MPRPTDAEVTKQQNRRIFIQLGGPLPGNGVQFAGLEAQYMVLQGVTRPLRTIEPIRVYNPRRAEQFRTVGRKVSAPDYATATLRLLENKNTLPFQLGNLDCPFNLYLPVGKCEDLSDFHGGPESIVEIVSWAEATSVDEGDRMAWEDDNQVEDAVSISLEAKYAIGALSFAAEAATDIAREVVDLVYGGGLQCGDCGPANDGTSRVYAVTKSSGAGSPGLPAEVVYTLDGGDTWNQTTIDGFGATEDPLAVRIVGDKLVVLGADAYYWATLSVLGVPGTFTKVTVGFVAAGTPLDMYVLNSQAVFFVGEGGYIYKATDITAGVEAVSAGDATTEVLYRINGDGFNTLVAVGAGSTVIKSTNRGESWAATSAEPVGTQVDVTAVWVKDERVYFVGTSDSARLVYTLDGGESWTAINFTGSGAGDIRDIVFATDEVGYFVHDDNTPTGRIWATWNGGASWVRNDGGSFRLLNWPVLDRINRIAVPDASLQTAANNLAVGGLAGDGTDGVLLLGKPNEV